MVSTLYIIFEDDIKRAALPPAADLPLEIVATLITVFFIVDMGERYKPCCAARRLNSALHERGILTIFQGRVIIEVSAMLCTTR